MPTERGFALLNLWALHCFLRWDTTNSEASGFDLCVIQGITDQWAERQAVRADSFYRLVVGESLSGACAFKVSVGSTQTRIACSPFVKRSGMSETKVEGNV